MGKRKGGKAYETKRPGSHFSPGYTGIIDACKVFRVAFMGEDFPYVGAPEFRLYLGGRSANILLPLCFSGQKLDLLRKNPRVAFEMDCGHHLMESDVPCGYGYRFQSVMGCGLAQEGHRCGGEKSGPFLPDGPPDRKAFSFTDREAEQVTVCRVLVQELSAKARDSM